MDTIKYLTQALPIVKKEIEKRIALYDTQEQATLKSANLATDFTDLMEVKRGIDMLETFWDNKVYPLEKKLENIEAILQNANTVFNAVVNLETEIPELKHLFAAQDKAVEVKKEQVFAVYNEMGAMLGAFNSIPRAEQFLIETLGFDSAQTTASVLVPNEYICTAFDDEKYDYIEFYLVVMNISKA